MTKKRPFDRLFAQLQDIDDAKGNHLNTVLWSKQGDCSVILEIRNPVPRFCMDAEPYMQFCDVLANIVQSLGEGYALQKQDIFCKKGYHHDIPEDMEFLSKSYFRYFEGREYTDIRTFLIITQEATHNMFVSYDPKKWLDFHAKISKVCDILKDKGIWCYTGFLFEQVVADPAMSRMLPYLDVLVDGPFIEAKKSLDLLFRGSSNQRLVDVQKSLKAGKVVEFDYNPYPVFD